MRPQFPSQPSTQQPQFGNSAVVALEAQAREVATSKLSKKAERNLMHPLLLRRIDNVLRGS